MASNDHILWTFGFDLWALNCVIVTYDSIQRAINQVLIAFDFVLITKW